MLETDSGRLPGGWNFYGRYSRIETQGYRERSWSKLWSYAFAVRRTLGSQSFRLNLYGGPEETHLAYLGLPRAYLEGGVSGDAGRDRRRADRGADAAALRSQPARAFPGGGHSRLQALEYCHASYGDLRQEGLSAAGGYSQDDG
jgi:hypothetical protein